MTEHRYVCEETGHVLTVLPLVSVACEWGDETNGGKPFLSATYQGVTVNGVRVPDAVFPPTFAATAEDAALDATRPDEREADRTGADARGEDRWLEAAE